MDCVIVFDCAGLDIVAGKENLFIFTADGKRGSLHCLHINVNGCRNRSAVSLAVGAFGMVIQETAGKVLNISR